MSGVSKFEIVAEPAKCVGCLICSLRCSLRFEKAFNPMKAQIGIITYFDRDNEIFFRDQCDSCGTCARYCPYGALTFKEGQV